VNLKPIEALLVPRLKRLLGRRVIVLAGPEMAPPLAGLQPTVCVHAARFIDHGGQTEEGARTGRQPVRVSGRLRGFEEQRPAHIVVVVTGIAATHRQAQELCEPISTEVLLRLESLSDVPLGARPGGAGSLVFGDARACLHEAVYQRDTLDDIGYHLGRMTFHLHGFLHVRLTGNALSRRSRTSAPAPGAGGAPAKKTGKAASSKAPGRAVKRASPTARSKAKKKPPRRGR